jgi:sugar-specific transcriptional regulator TrmB
MKRIPSLEALGLTRLESMAYAWLVGHPAATGYGVAKGIGKPTANVYRALESLARKGAVRTEGASPPRFRAVPPAQLLDQLEQEFRDRREIASQSLQRLEVPAPDDDGGGVHPLRTADQVLGRARLLLSAARRVVMLRRDDDVASALSDAIADARSRGVRVVELVSGGDPHDETDGRWPVEPAAGTFQLVADGREVVVATLPGGESREGSWTRAAPFVRTLHDALSNELFYAEVARGLRDGMSVDELEGAFERCRALRALVAR